MTNKIESAAQNFDKIAEKFPDFLSIEKIVENTQSDRNNRRWEWEVSEENGSFGPISPIFCPNFHSKFLNLAPSV